MRFQNVIIIFTCILTLIPLLARGDEYMSVQEFSRIHPEQAMLTRQFTSLVRGKGYPIAQGVQKQAVRIAFVCPGKQISDYWRRSILSLRKRMDEIGIRYELSEYFSKPAVDYRTQERQMKITLDEKPDYLVFTLDIRTHRRVIERIITKGRPRLILQNITTPLWAWESKQPFLYVGFDHARGTELLARYFLEQTRRCPARNRKHGKNPGERVGWRWP
ncbi:MAG: hypothetical protein B6245_05825 [Desulfobacteraceae bacterium 4572_88]|nr:MAG: hypothetical protein B6245_05825 [Desulfobacteraceae bacterium 4572_88]